MSRARGGAPRAMPVPAPALLLVLAFELLPAPAAHAGEILALEVAEDGSVQLHSELAAVDRASVESVACAATQALLDLVRIDGAVRYEVARRAVDPLLPALTEECRDETRRLIECAPAMGPSRVPIIVSVSAIEHLGPDLERARADWTQGDVPCAIRLTFRRDEARTLRVAVLEEICVTCFGERSCVSCAGTGAVPAGVCPDCQGTKQCFPCEGRGFVAELFDLRAEVIGEWDVLARAGGGSSVEPAAPRSEARETLLEIGAAAGRAFDSLLADSIAALLPTARETIEALFEDGVLPACPPQFEHYLDDWLVPALSVARIVGEGSDRATATLVPVENALFDMAHATLERGEDRLYRLASLRQPCPRCARGTERGRAPCDICEGLGELALSPSILARSR